MPPAGYFLIARKGSPETVGFRRAFGYFSRAGKAPRRRQHKPIQSPIPRQTGKNAEPTGSAFHQPYSLTSSVGGTICGAEAVAKSYPDFFEVLQALGIRAEIRP